MKKYIIGILMLGILLFALCGCGGSPLAKAYDSLSALTQGEAGSDTGTSVDSQFDVQYDEESETLAIDIENGAKLGPMFDALYEAVDGEDIGTLIFNLSGTKGDDYEKNLVKKIGKLPCNSLERLGLNYPILDYAGHGWVALADKTEKLYLDTNCNVFWDYSDKELKALSKIKDVQFAKDEYNLRMNGISKLSGIETLTFVPSLEVQGPESATEEKDPLAAVTEDNPYLNGDSTDSTSSMDSTEASANESGEEVPELKSFDYFSNDDDGIWEFGNMENLKTLFIYPETGYELTGGGETFIKKVQYLNPKLQVNAPGAAGTENLVAVTEIETPSITDDQAAELLAQILEDDVDKVYEECDKYSKKDGEAVLTGKSLIYVADPGMDDWSDKKVYSTIGDVKILEPSKEGIKVPASVGDYQTFVYIYPTYSRTGVYTSGTKAYSQTLHVQVYDMQDKVKYEAESVGTEPAPQSFSYFAGSVPDKHSGEVDLKKAYDYLSKLKTK